MKKITGIIILLTIFSKILGFLREIALSYYYGTSSISDAYLVSLIIPGTIFAFIGAGITTNFIPLFTDIENKEGSASANTFMNNVLIFIIILASIIFIFTFLFTEGIVKIFALGFEGKTLKLAVFFTKISIAGIFFYGINYIFTGFLNIKNNFIIPVLTTLPFNITIVLSIILSYYYNLSLLAVGSLAAIIFQVLFMLPSVFKNNFNIKLNFNIKEHNLKKIIFLSVPVILGTSVNQINRLVDRTIASIIETGGISALNYSNRVTHFILGIFVISITTVVFPSFAKMSSQKNIEGLKKLFIESTNAIIIIIIPAIIGFMIFSQQIISLLFGRGAFDANAILLTSSALFYYSFGLIGIGLRELVSRIFYSLHDTKTPMINAAIGMGLNIILNIILSHYLGIGGLALATSIAAIFTAFLMFTSLRKKIGPIGIKNIFISFLKILVASLAMGLFAKITFNYSLNTLTQDLSLVISMGVGIIFYFVIIFFMKIKEINLIIDILTKKFS